MLIKAKWPCSGFGTLLAGDLEMAMTPLMWAFTRLELDNNSKQMAQKPWSSSNVLFSNKHPEIDYSKSLFKLSSQ